MSEYTNKIALSWEEIERDSTKLAEKLKNKYGVLPRKMLAVTRGGMIPAALIAYKLGIKDIETVGLESYSGQTRADRVVLLKVAYPDFLDDTLVIDDVSDTGRTFIFLRPLTSNCIFASLYAKPTGEPYVDCFVRSFEQETWLDFPWNA